MRSPRKSELARGNPNPNLIRRSLHGRRLLNYSPGDFILSNQSLIENRPCINLLAYNVVSFLGRSSIQVNLIMIGTELAELLLAGNGCLEGDAGDTDSLVVSVYGAEFSEYNSIVVNRAVYVLF